MPYHHEWRSVEKSSWHWYASNIDDISLGMHSCRCISRASLACPNIFKTAFRCARVRSLCAIGKAIDNSQPRVRRSGKCATMFVNNPRAHSRKPRLCGEPEAKWSLYHRLVYTRHRAKTQIRINISFWIFDNICLVRPANSNSATMLILTTIRRTALYLWRLINRLNAVGGYRDIHSTIERDRMKILRLPCYLRVTSRTMRNVKFHGIYLRLDTETICNPR